jgi:hypothetical protein
MVWNNALLWTYGHGFGKEMKNSRHLIQFSISRLFGVAQN